MGHIEPLDAAHVEQVRLAGHATLSSRTCTRGIGLLLPRSATVPCWRLRRDRNAREMRRRHTACSDLGPAVQECAEPIDPRPLRARYDGQAPSNPHQCTGGDQAAQAPTADTGQVSLEGRERVPAEPLAQAPHRSREPGVESS